MHRLSKQYVEISKNSRTVEDLKSHSRMCSTVTRKSTTTVVQKDISKQSGAVVQWL